MAAGVYTVKIMVNGYFIPSYQYVAAYRAIVTVSDYNTPKISSIQPISGPPGTFVNITGDFKVSIHNQISVNLAFRVKLLYFQSIFRSLPKIFLLKIPRAIFFHVRPLYAKYSLTHVCLFATKTIRLILVNHKNEIKVLLIGVLAIKNRFTLFSVCLNNSYYLKNKRHSV
jgi:hypothetical protein